MATPQPFHSPRSWCFSLLHFIPSPVALTDFKRYVFTVCPEQSLPCRYIHFVMASRVLHGSKRHHPRLSYRTEILRTVQALPPTFPLHQRGKAMLSTGPCGAGLDLHRWDNKHSEHYQTFTVCCAPRGECEEEKGVEERNTITGLGFSVL